MCRTDKTMKIGLDLLENKELQCVGFDVLMYFIIFKQIWTDFFFFFSALCSA